MTVEGGHFANISGGHMFGSIFGSGENGHVWENARLNISGGEIGSETGTLIYSGNVYGSGRGVASTNTEYRQAAYVKNTLVTVKGSAHVYQNVFGGGNNAEVEGNAKVFIGR